jgi:hypothetical protein
MSEDIVVTTVGDLISIKIGNGKPIKMTPEAALKALNEGFGAQIVQAAQEIAARLKAQADELELRIEADKIQLEKQLQDAALRARQRAIEVEALIPS